MEWFLAFSTKKWNNVSAPKMVTLSITLTERQFIDLEKMLEGPSPYDAPKH
jgi:hypothetical protein